MVTTPAQAGKTWTRIPNGTKVRLSEGGQNGIIDGLTEFVVGTGRNPDGRTQYRVNVGDASRLLIAQDGLLILTDADGLVLMLKENVDYRRIVTEQLRGALLPDRFTIGV